MGVGYDRLDRPALNKAGVTVCNVPGTHWLPLSLYSHRALHSVPPDPDLTSLDAFRLRNSRDSGPRTSARPLSPPRHPHPQRETAGTLCRPLDVHRHAARAALTACNIRHPRSRSHRHRSSPPREGFWLERPLLRPLPTQRRGQVARSGEDEGYQGAVPAEHDVEYPLPVYEGDERDGGL